MKHKKIFIILLVFVSGLLLIISGVILSLSPKNLTINVLNSLNSNFKSFFNSELINFISNNPNIELDTNINYNVNKEENIIKLSYIENKNDKISSIKVSGVNSILNAYLSNNYIYLKNNEVDSYTYTDLNYISIFNNINYKNYDKLINLFIKTINEIIEDNDFTYGNTFFRINNESFKANRYNLILDKKLQKEILNKYINNIKNNKDALNSLSEIIGSNSNNKLDDILNNIDTYKYNDIDFSIFQDNITTLGFEFKNTKERFDIKFYRKDNNIQIELEIDNKIFNIVINKSRNNYVIDVKVVSNDEEIMKLNMKIDIIKSNNSTIYDYYILVKGDDKTTISGKYTKNDSNNEYDRNISIKVSSTNEISKYEIDNKFKIASNIQLPNFDKSVKVDKIFDMDLLNYSSKLYN